MRSYTVQTGDTLQGIAIKFLYRSALAYKIKQANNLPDNNVYAGQTLKIPEVEKTETKEYIGLKVVINGTELTQTPPVEIYTAINTIAVGATFEAPTEQLDFLKPYEYNDIEIYLDNAIILKGFVSKITNTAKETNTKAIEAFGKGQILSQVNYPVSSYPRTFYKKTLKQIFQKFTDLFNIELVIESDATDLANKKFSKVEISPEEKISDFLINLSNQKGLIVHGNSTGGIVLKNENVETENILSLVNYPGTSEFDSGLIFSDYTCLKNYSPSGSTQVARDKIDITEFRPKVFQIGKLQDDTIKTMIKKEIKKDLINSFKLSIDLPYVTDTNDELIAINKQMYFENENLDIMGADFVIKSAKYSFLDTGMSVSIELTPVSFLEGDFESFWI